MTTYSRDRLEQFLARVDGKLLTIYKNYGDVVQADLVDIAQYEASFEAKSLSNALSFDAVVPTNAVIRAAIFSYPLQVQGINGGKLLKSFMSGWTKGEAQRVTSTIRLGFGQGQTNAEIIRAVRGTAAQNFTDGILAISNRNASAVVQTAIQHVATTARMETANANSDVVVGVKIIATLDRKTSQLCKGMDQMEFPLDKGPRPPFHIHCRTTFTLITKLSEFFAKGATRASVGDNGGEQVDAGKNYYEWLATQPASFQDHALGPVRGKLFRNGGLPPDKFAKLQLSKTFKPLTLAELQAIEPDMFTRAGVTLSAQPG